MPLDSGLVAETRAWLREAVLDVRAAEILVRHDPDLAVEPHFIPSRLLKNC